LLIEKSSKEYSVVFLMEGEKFNLCLGDKVQAKSSNLPSRFCSNWVAISLEFAAFRSGFDAKYSRASAFWFFFCPQPWFLRRSKHVCQEKHQHFHAYRQLVTMKEISIKINFKNDNKRSWRSGLNLQLLMPTSRVQLSARAGNFSVFFSFLFFSYFF